jgi:hypothetical protein
VGEGAKTANVVVEMIVKLRHDRFGSGMTEIV